MGRCGAPSDACPAQYLTVGTAGAGRGGAPHVSFAATYNVHTHTHTHTHTILAGHRMCVSRRVKETSVVVVSTRNSAVPSTPALPAAVSATPDACPHPPRPQCAPHPPQCTLHRFRRGCASAPTRWRALAAGPGCAGACAVRARGRPASLRRSTRPRRRRDTMPFDGPHEPAALAAESAPRPSLRRGAVPSWRRAVVPALMRGRGLRGAMTRYRHDKQFNINSCGRGLRGALPPGCAAASGVTQLSAAFQACITAHHPPPRPTPSTAPRQASPPQRHPRLPPP